MKKAWRSAVCMVLTLLTVAGSVSAFALEPSGLEEAIRDVAAYLYEAVPDPQVNATGGEWTVLGLARSGCDVPEEYYQNYYRTVEAYVTERGGVLHDKKYTEYSRVILALTAIGKDPSDVGGYNLLSALGDYEKTVWQGINGPIWALLALDSGNYEIPQNPDAQTQATRDMYIGYILEHQLPDGGWSLLGEAGNGVSDPDITGMALQALAKYQDRADVKQAAEEALACMSAQQDETGGFASWGAKNSESCVQMIVALCELGLQLDDARFVKNGNTILDGLMTYYEAENGFAHTGSDGGSNLMATEQGFYALVAVKRALDGENSLYRMDDVAAETGGTNTETPGIGLEGKHDDVQMRPVIHPGITFSDITGHANQQAIEALAQRGIINGKSEDSFDPDANMTRAEFATIVVQALGLPVNETASAFRDVAEQDWFCTYVNTAYAYGIVNGVSETEFDPNGTITREEAAVMTARAAKLCGMDTEMDSTAARDILAGFTDYVTASGWAAASLAFCYHAQILPDDAMEILPQQAITRSEIAQMLYNLLGSAKLL